eukprot:scaffold14781_cov113-Isochrysis_galbana.AAC.2
MHIAHSTSFRHWEHAPSGVDNLADGTPCSLVHVGHAPPQRGGMDSATRAHSRHALRERPCTAGEGTERLEPALAVGGGLGLDHLGEQRHPGAHGGGGGGAEDQSFAGSRRVTGEPGRAAMGQHELGLVEGGDFDGLNRVQLERRAAGWPQGGQGGRGAGGWIKGEAGLQHARREHGGERRSSRSGRCHRRNDGCGRHLPALGCVGVLICRSGEPPARGVLPCQLCTEPTEHRPPASLALEDGVIIQAGLQQRSRLARRVATWGIEIERRPAARPSVCSADGAALRAQSREAQAAGAKNASCTRGSFPHGRRRGLRRGGAAPSACECAGGARRGWAELRRGRVGLPVAPPPRRPAKLAGGKSRRGAAGRRRRMAVWGGRPVPVPRGDEAQQRRSGGG